MAATVITLADAAIELVRAPVLLGVAADGLDPPLNAVPHRSELLHGDDAHEDLVDATIEIRFLMVMLKWFCSRCINTRFSQSEGVHLEVIGPRLQQTSLHARVWL